MRRTPRPAGSCPRLLLAALAAAALSGAALPAAARAQGPPARRSNLGASVGPVVPLGELGRAADLGMRGSAWIESPAGGGAAGRLEGAFDHFTSDRAPPAGGRAAVSIFSLTANVVTTGRRDRIVPGRVRGYVVGGLGVYTTRTSAGGVFGGVATGKTESHARIGVNGGGGVHLPIGGLQLLVEARFHLLLAGSGFGSRNTGYLPLMLGLRF
jgi:hypothetical protein